MQPPPFRGMQKNRRHRGICRWSGEIHPSALEGGYLTGESRETCPTGRKFNNHKASELIWEIDNVYMINFNGAITIAKKLVH